MLGMKDYLGRGVRGSFHALHLASPYLNSTLATQLLGAAKWIPCLQDAIVNPMRIHKALPTQYRKHGKDYYKQEEQLYFVFVLLWRGYQTLQALRVIGTHFGLLNKDFGKQLENIGTWSAVGSIGWEVVQWGYKQDQGWDRIGKMLFTVSRVNDSKLMHAAGLLTFAPLLKNRG